jgi:hypothetical protein
MRINVLQENSVPNDNAEQPALNFRQVLAEENAVISSARQHLGIDDENKRPAAICLSGGGIRSATFCLGGLQALDQGRLLQQFDYLSTVSGGGYIGSWLSKLIKAIQDRNVTSNTKVFGEVGKKEDTVNGRTEADRNRIEPAALQFLRENSSYLTPQNGLFSGDSWSLVAIYLRNLILNWLIILPFVAACLAVPYFCILTVGSIPSLFVLTAFFILGTLAILYPTIVPAWPDVVQNEKERKKTIDISHVKWMGLNRFLVARLLPFELALFFLASWLYQNAARSADGFVHLGPAAQSTMLWMMGCGFILPVFTLWVWGTVESLREDGLGRSKLKSPRARITFAVQTVGALSAVGATLLVTEQVPCNNVWFYVWFPAVATINFLVAGTLFAGLVDPLVEDENREWWARSAGYFLMFVLLWVGLASISVSVPCFFGLLTPEGIGSKAWVLHLTNQHGTMLTTSGLVALLGGGATAFLTRAESQLSAAAKFWETAQDWLRNLLFVVSMTLFAAALLLLLEFGVFWSASKLMQFFAMDASNRAHDLFALGLVILILVAFCLAMSLPVNINRFSAHIAYRNRLVRTFLGASNLGRKYNPFTGFSKHDNVYLHQMAQPWSPGVSSDETRSNIAAPPDPAAQVADQAPKVNKAFKPDQTPKAYQRPLHVICAAVNLAQGERLAWQERKAVSFTFSGLHCGSTELGYRPSEKYGGGRGITLGTAMTVSAAAANSGMGFYSSPLKSFLMTLLNARLGWWLGNPSQPMWRRNSPIVALGPLLSELFSLTDRKAAWINVSDGGHFDNTGVYEMLRRRCKNIVLFDADTTRKGIANAAQRARVDMGVKISLVAKPSDGFPCEHYRIRYFAESGEFLEDGMLVRFYPALGSDNSWSAFENCEHQRVNPEFPDDALVNQFFTESIFESYRRLGMDIVGHKVSQASADGSEVVALEKFFKVCCAEIVRPTTNGESPQPDPRHDGIVLSSAEKSN